MILPRTFRLGSTFTVRRKRMRTRGYYDHAAREIAIADGTPPLGEVIVLIHEMMHATECGMLERGTICAPVDHDFVHAAAYGAGLALAKCGALSGVGPKEIAAFVRGLKGER